MKQTLALVAVVVGLGCSDSTAPVSNSFAGVWGLGAATSEQYLSVTQTGQSITGIVVLMQNPDLSGVTLSGTVANNNVSFTLGGGGEIPSTFIGHFTNADTVVGTSGYGGFTEPETLVRYHGPR
jgi:hypothetical protein